jgi:hypothetical protein
MYLLVILVFLTYCSGANFSETRTEGEKSPTEEPTAIETHQSEKDALANRTRSNPPTSKEDSESENPELERAIQSRKISCEISAPESVIPGSRFKVKILMSGEIVKLIFRNKSLTFAGDELSIEVTLNESSNLKFQIHDVHGSIDSCSKRVRLKEPVSIEWIDRFTLTSRNMSATNEKQGGNGEPPLIVLEGIDLSQYEDISFSDFSGSLSLRGKRSVPCAQGVFLNFFGHKDEIIGGDISVEDASARFVIPESAYYAKLGFHERNPNHYYDNLSSPCSFNITLSGKRYE